MGLYLGKSFFAGKLECIRERRAVRLYGKYPAAEKYCDGDQYSKESGTDGERGK